MADTTSFHTPARMSVRARTAVLAAAMLLALPGRIFAAAPPTGSVTLPVSPAASAPAPASPRAAKPTLGCLISPERVADIGSPVVGVVSAISVDNGTLVQAGQPLVVLRSDVEQAGLHAAQARSAIEADVYAAKANLMLAHQRHARAVELLGEGFVSA